MTSLARFLHNATFKQQLSIAVTAGVICFALLSSLLLSWQGSRQIRLTLLAQGERSAENLARNSALALLYGSADNAEEAIKAALAFPDVLRVEIRQRDGKALVVRSPDGAPDTAGTANEAGAAPLSDSTTHHGYLEAEDAAAWHFVAPVLKVASASPFEATESQDEFIGFVRVVQSKETLARLQSRIIAINLAFALLFSLVFVVLIRMLANRLARPVSALSSAMARAERGDAEVLAKIGGPKDIRDMAHAFNRMIAALQERERALRESQASYREVFDGVREVIFQTDANDRWVLLNPAWHEITGFDVAATIGQPMSAQIDCGGLPMKDRKFDPTGSDSHRFEAPFTRRDGSHGWCEIALHARRDENGAYAGTSGTLRDVTERRRAEQKLAELNAELEQRVIDRTARLEAANKDLESFSYSVSHDLRAPLRAVSGFAQILSERHRGSLDEQACHYLDNIVTAGKRMATLIEDLLQYSRTGRGAVRSVPVPLEPITQRLASTFGERIARAGAQWTVVPPLATPLGDPTLIEQILVNLVDNALTYHCRDGTPTVRVSATREGESVILRVADNGIGIAPEYHEKIFQVFQRLHGEDEYPGTGIGLAIVAKAVRMMDGEIHVESALDQGSTFSIRLPVAGNEQGNSA